MPDGWVKAHRKLLDWPWFANPTVAHLWEYCRLKATHAECTVVVGLTPVKLLPGQFVFGLKKASIETGLTIQKLRRALEVLSESNCLERTVHSTNRFSIITLVNWDRYQGEECDTNTTSNTQTTRKQHANNTQTTCRQHTDNTQTTTDKNGKNGKKKSTVPHDPPPFEFIMTQYNAVCPLKGLPVAMMTEKRKGHLRARWQEPRFREHYKEVFYKASGSAFLTGSNPSGWKVDFGWIIQSEENYIKILEGRYDGTPSNRPNRQTGAPTMSKTAIADARGYKPATKLGEKPPVAHDPGAVPPVDPGQLQAGGGGDDSSVSSAPSGNVVPVQ